MLFFESSLADHRFPPFEAGYSPWDAHEPAVLFQDEKLVVFNSQFESHNSNSYDTNPAPVKPNSKNSKTLSPGSDETSHLGSVEDERKRRRMISNRASARRSRMRKQKHFENLRNQLNRLRLGNRELMNRVRLAVHQNQLIRLENEHLRSEAAVLRQRVWDIRQVLVVRQLQQHLNSFAWPCNNNITSINDGQLPHHSLIT